MSELAKLFIFSLSAVVYLFILSKLLGKKQIAQLDFIDYVMGISIGSIAAEMSTDTSDRPFYYYLIAMGIFFLFDVIISWLGKKGPTLKKFFKGKPSTLIYEGKINYKALKKSGIDVNDLISLCREKSYFDLSNIAYAVFETNGELSILPKGNAMPPTLKDLKDPKIKKSSLPIYLVIDGRISYSSLSELNKQEDWLLKRLNVKNKKDLKNILIAVYDEKADKIILHKKREV